MLLLLNPSQKNSISLALFDEARVAAKTCEGSNKEILFFIDELLKDQRVDKKDVQGIAVVVGAGTFTGTRLAVTIANTFGYALQIPLLAISEQEAEDPQALIPRLLSRPKGEYLSATYSGEPRVGET